MLQAKAALKGQHDRVVVQEGKRSGRWLLPSLSAIHRLLGLEEHNLPLLSTLSLKKAFNCVEAEAVITALVTQNASNQYARAFLEVYKGLTTHIYLTILQRRSRQHEESDTTRGRHIPEALQCRP